MEVEGLTISGVSEVAAHGWSMQQQRRYEQEGRRRSVVGERKGRG